MPEPDYFQITNCIEGFFDRFGDTPQGMGWPNTEDALRRHQVMLRLIRNASVTPAEEPIHVLDLGCGCGQFYEFLKARGTSNIRYTGIDLSERFIGECRSKFPEADFRCLDVMKHPELLETFDYAVLNGLFTMKCAMSFDVMWDFVQRLVRLAFHHTRHGIAFNAMSKHVDWERDDLFHLPMDLLAAFLCSQVSRHFVMRNDYGLYEFTTYVYHERSEKTVPAPK
ncbi:MAG: class I SAM-dependent methyltransferase [Planctomyces sp.]